MAKISASVLSADFAALGREIEEVRAAGAEYLHLDIMDGIFVPNITIGIPVLKSIRKVTDMFFDVHLMVDRPIRYVERFCDAGADLVTIHFEADRPERIAEALKKIRQKGKKAGLSISPGTPAEFVDPYIRLIDLALVMTVEPGFGGQSFMEDMLPKISQVSELIRNHNPECELEVDGGIGHTTAILCRNAGANVLVAGSALFGKPDRVAAIAALRG